MEEMVSIIIPTYNREKYIERAVQSILGQTYDRYEIIIVDDGSTDNTREIIRVLEDKDDRIRYIKLEENRGPAYARNIGMKEAKSEFIAFLDSDDEWLPDKLKLQMDKMLEFSEETALVFCRMSGIRRGRKDRYVCPDESIDKESLEGNIFSRLLWANLIGTPSALVRKKCLEQVGGFKESLTCLEDWEWILRIAKNWKIGFVDEILVEVHKLPGSVSTNMAGYLIARCYLVSLYRDEMSKNGSLEFITQEILEKAERRGIKSEIQELLHRDFDL